MATHASSTSNVANFLSVDNKGKRKFLILLTVALAILPSLNDYRTGTASRLDVCFINREFETPPLTVIPLRDGPLHDLSVLIMWTAMLVLCMLPNQRPLAFFRLVYAALWFHATYILLAALKSMLLDYNCAGRHKLFPNGISGHYCYFVFVTLTVPSLARARLTANPTVSKLVKRLTTFLLYLFLVGGISTLYRTYFHGYHSPRQILLGTALGLAAHITLDYILFPIHQSNSLALTLTTLLAHSVTSLSLYFRWWPHHEAGVAISGGQLVFHLSLWLVLILITFILPRPEKKEL